MGALLTTGSILAAFFAGAVALFSPCCIVFLLPAYLASAVKNRRWRLVPLTLVFALGLAVVLVPITLGVGLVSSALARYHTPLYVAGGLLLLALAALSLLGRSWSMPSFVRAPAVGRPDSAGVFALGVFSGVASSCCAPVLAGVVTLSALASSPVGSLGLGLAYVFGMVFPLLAIALLWDRFHIGERRLLKARPVNLRIPGRTIVTNTPNLAISMAFALMGVVVLVLAATGDTSAAPGAQLALGRWLSGVFGWIVSALDPIPESVLGLGLLALAALLVLAGFARRPSQPAHERSRHEHEDDVREEGPEAHAGEGAGESASAAGRR